MVKAVPFYLPLTRGTSLARYLISPPGKYYIAVQAIEISIARNQESACGLSRKQRVFFYDQQGQVDQRTKKGIFIDFYC
jgi:hypothetical protein